MRDFTTDVYEELLAELIGSAYTFKTYEQFVQLKHNTGEKAIILRHDVDAKKQNSLAFAKIQHARGIAGTYYFRNVAKSFDESLMKEIAGMGHEIGYHYETMDTERGDIDRAYDEFCRVLEKFRKVAPIKTICMHGSPMSPYDNRDIWTKYDYRSLGLIAEPYFDLDFNEVYYLTDTGRRWDGSAVSVRDKALSGRQSTNPLFTQYRFHTTREIIAAVRKSEFPHTVMMTFHPQRWADSFLPWIRELLLQNLKNQVKKVLISRRKS